MSTESIQTVKVRIKPGAPIYQDHAFFTWPGCKPPKEEYGHEQYHYVTKHPDAIFDALLTDGGRQWRCTRPGYGQTGQIGKYGNGAIYILVSGE